MRVQHSLHTASSTDVGEQCCMAHVEDATCPTYDNPAEGLRIGAQRCLAADRAIPVEHLWA